MKALKANKHVLVEKPVALSADDYLVWMELALSKGLILMDGTMFPHHSRTQQVVQWSQKDLGTVNRIESSFSFLGDNDFFESNIRIREDPLGCIGDLGWYCTRMAMLAFGNLSIESAQTVNFKLNSFGVPLEATCAVKFSQVRTALLLKYSTG